MTDKMLQEPEEINTGGGGGEKSLSKFYKQNLNGRKFVLLVNKLLLLCK
jgi:hypothetical protein